jgi:hypothetical protein
MCKKWTPVEDKILLDNPQLGYIELQKLIPNRSINSISNRWNRIKPPDAPNRCKITTRWWSPEEDQILLENAHLGWEELHKMLPKRSIHGIKHRYPLIKTTKLPKGHVTENQLMEKCKTVVVYDYNPIYHSGYDGRLKNKCMWKCPVSNCNNLFVRAPAYVINSQQIFCRQCTIGLAKNKQRLDPIEADKIEKEFGAIPLEPYFSDHTKRKYQCANTECVNTFKRTPKVVKASIVRYQKTGSELCIYCDQCVKNRLKLQYQTPINDIKQHMDKCGIIWLSGEFENVHSKLRVRCKCGNEYDTTYAAIKYRNITTCGMCDCPLSIGQKIFNWTVLDLVPISGGVRGLFQCKCGTKKWLKTNIVLSGNTKSCGHCNDPKINERNNWKLTAVIIFPEGLGCSVVAQCDCGEYTRLLKGNEFWRNKTCGNCGLYRNSQCTSSPVLQLQKELNNQTPYNFEANLNIPYVGKVDLGCQEQKIAIEYHGYYYHRVLNDNTLVDNAKVKRIIDNDWKVLIIKSGGQHENDFPTLKRIKKVLFNDFCHNKKRHTITMSSWYKAKKRIRQNKLLRQQNNNKPLINYWTKKEDDWLLKHFLTSTKEQILNALPGRTWGTINTRWQTIKPANSPSRREFDVSNGRLWTPKEDRYVKNHFDLGAQQLSEQLGRTVAAVSARMKRHRPSNYKVRNGGGKLWSEKELQYLKSNPPKTKEDIVKIATKLGRTPKAVSQRYRKLLKNI